MNNKSLNENSAQNFGTADLIGNTKKVKKLVLQPEHFEIKTHYKFQMHEY